MRRQNLIETIVHDVIEVFFLYCRLVGLQLKRNSANVVHYNSVAIAAYINIEFRAGHSPNLSVKLVIFPSCRLISNFHSILMGCQENTTVLKCSCRFGNPKIRKVFCSRGKQPQVLSVSLLPAGSVNGPLPLHVAYVGLVPDNDMAPKP